MIINAGEVPCIPCITACHDILQEREQRVFNAGGEVMYNYYSIFHPPIHKVLMLSVPSMPDETDQSMHCVEDCRGRLKNSQYVHQFSVLLAGWASVFVHDKK
jgi:hypothetical protein